MYANKLFNELVVLIYQYREVHIFALAFESEASTLYMDAEVNHENAGMLIYCEFRF